MSDVVETLEPLQSCSDANGVSSSLTGVAGQFAISAISDHRMRRRLANNVGPGSSCRSPNPNCSPGASAACRVRWEMQCNTYTCLVCVFPPQNSILKWQNLLVYMVSLPPLCQCTRFLGDPKTFVNYFLQLGACIYFLLMRCLWKTSLPFWHVVLALILEAKETHWVLCCYSNVFCTHSLYRLHTQKHNSMYLGIYMVIIPFEFLKMFFYPNLDTSWCVSFLFDCI